MASYQEDQRRPVAFLHCHDSSTQAKGDIRIYAPTNLVIGRIRPYGDRVPWYNDITISNEHLRIHTISYEGGESCKIQPLVYAEDLSTNGTSIKHHSIDQDGMGERDFQPMQKGIAILLGDGDELRLSPTLTFNYSVAEPDKSEPDMSEPDGFSELQLAEQKLFSNKYTVTKRKLGAGGYGGVYLAWHRPTRRQLACKVINRIDSPDPSVVRSIYGQGTAKESKNKPRLRPLESFSKQFREFEVLQDLDHPNIISLEKVFWSDHTIYMLSELITAGDLFSYLEFKGGRLDEVTTLAIVRQILEALEYLHSKDIVHRDLKPDNILMTSLSDGARVVLTDFGQARFLPKEEALRSRRKKPKYRMTSLAGTADYVAPEVFNRNDKMKHTIGYSEAVDMWSVGAVTALLVSGSNIFDVHIPDEGERSPQNKEDAARDHDDRILGAAAKCDLSRMDHGREWRSVGARAKDFIRSLLVLNESQRMTATQALAHEWFTAQHYRADFDALYETAIKDWKPRRKVNALAEYLGNIRNAQARKDSSPDPLSLTSPYFNQFAPKAILSRLTKKPPVVPGSVTSKNITKTDQLEYARPRATLRSKRITLHESVAGHESSFPEDQFRVSQPGPPIDPSRSPCPSSFARALTLTREGIANCSIEDSSLPVRTPSPLAVQGSSLFHGNYGIATQYQISLEDETQFPTQETTDPAAIQCIPESPPEHNPKRPRYTSYGRIDSDVYMDLSHSTGSCLVSAKAYKEHVNNRRARRLVN